LSHSRWVAGRRARTHRRKSLTQKTADKEQVGGEKKEGQPESESPSEETAPSGTKEKQEPAEQTSQQPNLPPSPAEQVKKRKKRPFEFKISAHGYASLQYQVGSTVQGTEQGRQVYRYENYGLSKGFNAYGSLQVDWQIGNLSIKGEWTPCAILADGSKVPHRIQRRQH
jgi:hypothetical protein